uniref:Gypsy retrotransposon integrase-like protein 1 n=1 Tax=Acanthochromis polyacanthus TaxID=80966 RepID=A0A3Q1F1W9_9TELE
MGHLGVDRTLDLVRARFYWPKMASDVETKIKMCPRCVRRKTPQERTAPMVNIRTTRPLELICMDFLSLEPDTSNVKDILVLTDHFTKFALAFPTPNQKARTVAKCLWENFIVYYGFPERIHTDQGPDFESKLIKELCEVTGIRKSRTTLYHPRGNPVERFNRTLFSMLGTLENKQKSKWREHVKPLVHAYNCTRNEVTGYTPYELMFGHLPRLPVDIAFGLPVQQFKHKSHSQYVQNLRSRLQESYQIASRNALKSAERNKVRFDQRVTSSVLEPGDRVLVRNVRIRGKHKLVDKWEENVYVVVKKAGDLPVYTVTPENKNGPLRTLHRDLLLPCGFLSADSERVQPVPFQKQCTYLPNPKEDENDPGEFLGSDGDPLGPIVTPNLPPARFTVTKSPTGAPISLQESGNAVPTLPPEDRELLLSNVPEISIEQNLPLDTSEPVQRENEGEFLSGEQLPLVNMQPEKGTEHEHLSDEILMEPVENERGEQILPDTSMTEEQSDQSYTASPTVNLPETDSDQ